LANRAGWSLRQGSRSQISTLTQKLLGANRLPQNIIFLVIFLIVAAYQIIGNLLEYAFAQDIGLFGIGLAILTLLARLFHHPSAAAALYRLTIYTSLILATYAVDRAYGNAIWMDIAFVILAGWIAMGVKYAGDYYFNLTPSDFLVMFILLASAYLPMFHQINIAQVAVKAAVLLYGVEFILRRRGKASVILWLLSALGFLQLSLRSLL
jgi:UDP-GlcNAc:undecaprenyl-phosphate GlcNAc-1-phosphate transferase